MFDGVSVGLERNGVLIFFETFTEEGPLKNEASDFNLAKGAFFGKIKEE